MGGAKKLPFHICVGIDGRETQIQRSVDRTHFSGNRLAPLIPGHHSLATPCAKKRQKQTRRLALQAPQAS